MSNLSRSNLYLFIVLLLSVLTSNIAIANTQSVCIDKKTGAVRVSNTCKTSESKGTQEIKPPKPTKADVLQKLIASLELSIEQDKKVIEEYKQDPGVIGILESLGAKDLAQSSQICANPMLDGRKKSECALLASLENQIQSLEKSTSNRAEKLLDAKSRLQNELKGYKTISCKKGREILTITDAKPKCPKGYK